MPDSSPITPIPPQNPHPNPPRSESDMSDYEALFGNGLNIEKADHSLLNKYVIYRVSQYMTLDTEDYGLWVSIQRNFVQFTENHLKLLNEST